jgi:hypothetical protein
MMDGYYPFIHRRMAIIKLDNCWFTSFGYVIQLKPDAGVGKGDLIYYKSPIKWEIVRGGASECFKYSCVFCDMNVALLGLCRSFKFILKIAAI